MDTLRKLDVRVDVTSPVNTGEPLEVAVTVVLPAPNLPAPTTAMFAFPGGGYNRRYYDLPLRGRLQPGGAPCCPRLRLRRL